MYGSVYSNFVGGELRIGAEELGLIESIREVPGLLAVLGGILCAYAAEHVLAGICLLIAGLGFMSVSLASDLMTLIPAVLLWSLGFHFFSPLHYALSLESAGKKKARVLGEIAGFSAA